MTTFRSKIMGTESETGGALTCVKWTVASGARECSPAAIHFVTLIWLSRYRESLRAGWSGNRIPVGARFSAPVQSGRGVQPASYTVDTASLSRRKAAGAWR
jgi:hypothetical protein